MRSDIGITDSKKARGIILICPIESNRSVRKFKMVGLGGI